MNQDKNINTLDQLKEGQKAIIDSFTDREISLKLLEMGCLPGEEIWIEYIAPLGCPIAVSVNGFVLGLRRKEAASVIIRRV